MAQILLSQEVGRSPSRPFLISQRRKLIPQVTKNFEKFSEGDKKRRPGSMEHLPGLLGSGPVGEPRFFPLYKTIDRR